MPVNKAEHFFFEEAFSRSLGWLTERELQVLRGKKVAIAGLGGVGGSHLLTLARLGVGSFHIADSDVFELGNFNRQAGAVMSTIGKSKVEVMATMARDINPELDITTFGHINEENIHAFLQGADVFLDGIDSFMLEIKRLVFRHCAMKAIPAVTAGPFGTGSAYITFLPGQMTFDEYFAFEGLPPQEQQMNFFIGVAPKFLHWGYIADTSLINLKLKRGVTTPMACQLSSAMAATEAMKILLGRGKVYAAPHYQQFDPYLNTFRRGRLAMGMKNPLMSVRKIAVKRLLKKMTDQPRPPIEKPKETPLGRILDAARWAPSADNLQPWRIEIKGDRHFIVHVRKYAFQAPLLSEKRNGLPNILSAGMMLENIRIAASAEGMKASWHCREDGDAWQIDVTLTLDNAVRRDALHAYIPLRSVNRRNYKTMPLTQAEKAELARAAGEALSLTWHEGFRNKLGCVQLNARASDIRLREEKAYHEIQHILDWEHRFSNDRIPVHTLPLSPLTLTIMRWALKRWQRIRFLNTWLGGTMMPRLEMDVVPGLCSAAHFALAAKHPLRDNDADGLLALGSAIQRFWLTATRLGLVLQPSYATLVFGYLGASGEAFSEDARLNRKAAKLATDVAGWYRSDVNALVFLGRIGRPAAVLDSRSLRKPVDALLINAPALPADGSQALPSSLPVPPAAALR
ncbi:MAG: ThiF family adenylyltransferase [Pseudomonadota bacterium]|nr:ThiF family adenylyltransferase [Pseudomonadota bacterium]